MTIKSSSGIIKTRKQKGSKKMRNLNFIEYYTAWERVKRAEEELESAKKAFREIAGNICENLMKENKDVFERLAQDD